MDLLSKRLPMFQTIWLPGKKAEILLIDPVLALQLIASHCLITARSSRYYSDHVRCPLPTFGNNYYCAIFSVSVITYLENARNFIPGKTYTDPHLRYNDGKKRRSCDFRRLHLITNSKRSSSHYRSRFLVSVRGSDPCQANERLQSRLRQVNGNSYYFWTARWPIVCTIE